MSVKLLTEYHLESLRLKGGCIGSSDSTHQNATLLQITCGGSYAEYVINNSTHFVYIANAKKLCYMKQQNHSFESAC